MVRLEKIKTRRGKRILEDRAPKTIENDKKALIVKGGKTNETVNNVLKELYSLKKPLVNQLKRRNPFHPFEDETPIERFSNKFDTSLFLFGSNSKKHPNSLIFGRMFDGNLLDMVELRVENYEESSSTEKMTLGSKPCILLEGPEFDTDPTMNRVGNLLVDWFRGPVVDKIRLQGLETIISFSTKDGKLLMRVYKVVLKKSPTNPTTPFVELENMGPSIDFVVDRKKLASDSLFKTACRKPKALISKRRKNMSEDVFGTQLARIHVGKQNTDAIQTRKVKALRKGKPADAQPTSAQDTSDVEMEE